MPAAAPFAAPASRNAPCPCGSGRRYKECHGAIGAGSPLDTILRDALAAQQAGRLAEAIAGYEQAIAVAPAHFDALHMLGVALYQRGEFERALAFIDRALAVQPGFPSAVFNRQLVRHGLALRSVQDEIARAVLPRLARFVADVPPRADDAPLHVVLATPAEEPAALEAGERLASGRAVARWRETGRPVHPDARDWPSPRAPAGYALVDAGAGRHPQDGHVIVVGAERPPSAWWERCTPASVTLVAMHDRPALVAARIRELAGDGRRRIGLVYADARLAQRCRLPGGVLERPQ